jgi:cysteine synthase
LGHQVVIFIPDWMSQQRVAFEVSVSDGDALLMAQKLAASVGLAVGISSGANFIGALMAQTELGDDAVVTTAFPNDNKKYLSTDLLRDEPVKDSDLAPEVQLLDYEALKRVCYTCFDGEG